jgi:hypothetical protein
VTPTREAITLPLLFLTVVLAASVQTGTPLQFVPPPPFALLLAMLLVGSLVQCGALAPDLLVSPQRSSLENLNGLVVVLTLFAASAGAMAVVLPASGAPAVLMGILLFALLAQALAIGASRSRMLRGLLVSFGVAFTLKYIVLASLSAPAEGRMGRIVQLLFEGVTLGAITQAPTHPAAPYLAFAALILYLFGLVLLPRHVADYGGGRDPRGGALLPPERMPWPSIDDPSSNSLPPH